MKKYRVKNNDVYWGVIENNYLRYKWVEVG